MKIALFEIEPWERELLKSLESDHQVTDTRRKLQPDNAGDFSEAEIISPFVYSDLGREVLEQLPDLQLIATRSTGYDHVDLDYCDAQGITVCNVPTYGENTVAEHVFALLLALGHRLIEAVDRSRRGDFTWEGMQGFDLRGKTFGVIGTGNIGRSAIAIARGFGMEVIASDISPDRALAEKLGFRYVTQNELLERADIITLHVPGGEKTRKLISHDEIAAMKDGVVIINTSRGTVLDIEALVKGLAEGKVAGAGLDVLPHEPVIREEAELLRSVFSEKYELSTLLAEHVLLNLRNVVITPHSAFRTREAVQRILDATRENIDAFVAGQPQNTVGKA